MSGHLKVKDRTTSEQGELFECMGDGRVRVLMESGEIREYPPKDLVGTIESGRERAQENSQTLRDHTLTCPTSAVVGD
ncbi:MAG: hypothetical protein ACR2PT_02275 [Endozoicomonas sp.]